MFLFVKDSTSSLGVLAVFLLVVQIGSAGCTEEERFTEKTNWPANSVERLVERLLSTVFGPRILSSLVHLNPLLSQTVQGASSVLYTHYPINTIGMILYSSTFCFHLRQRVHRNLPARPELLLPFGFLMLRYISTAGPRMCYDDPGTLTRFRVRGFTVEEGSSQPVTRVDSLGIATSTFCITAKLGRGGIMPSVHSLMTIGSQKPDVEKEFPRASQSSTCKGLLSSSRLTMIRKRGLT